MKLIHAALLLAAVALPLHAKDEIEISLDKCPQPVQAAINQQVAKAQGTLDKVEFEKKDGAEFYEAKVTAANGIRWTVRFAADGRILETKQKKAK